MKTLIGREREMGELERCLRSDRSEFVIVYGRRRVGKTFLVDEFFQHKYDFTFVGGHKLSQKKQLRNFAKAIKAALPNADGKMVAQVVQSQLAWEQSELVSATTQLKLMAADGKRYLSDAIDQVGVELKYLIETYG